MSEDTESQAAELVAPLFHAVANPHRIELLHGLHQKQSRAQLVQELPISESGVSNHLRVLEDAGLVYRTEDRWVVSPLGKVFAVFLDEWLEVLEQAVARVDSAEAEAREEFADVPLAEQELEAAVTRRKWELVRDELEELVTQLDDTG